MKNNRKQYKKKYILLIIGIILLLTIMKVVYDYNNCYKIIDRRQEIKLFEKENDIMPLGWLRVQGTSIDFPIFYSNSIDISDGTYDFGWTNKTYNYLTDRTVILSHNVRNVSKQPLIADDEHKRFEQLPSFLYYSFAKKNKYIQYTTDNKNYIFKIYAVSIQENVNEDGGRITKKEKDEYIKKAQKNSYFNYGIDVDSTDKLITLITCTRFYGDSTDYSIVIDARLERINERESNYKVTKNNDKYKKVESILKGDVSDE